MKFGLMLPNKGRSYGDANLLVELAFSAEQAGWEGFFLWDHIGGGGDSPTMDSWICLGAIASQTQTMRLGTMVTPLARRRPWKVAREMSPWTTSPTAGPSWGWAWAIWSTRISRPSARLAARG